MPESPRSHRLLVASLLGLVTCATALGDSQSRQRDAGMEIRALAPLDVVASAFQELSAIAVEPTGATLVTDRAAGTLTRIGERGDRQTLLDHLQGPSGVATDSTGTIFLVEAAGRRLIRVDPDGRATVVASVLRQPRSVAVGPDGRVWIAIRTEMPRRGEEQGEGGNPASEYVIARLEESGTLATVASGLMGVRGLAADANAVYVAMSRLARERGRVRTTVARIAIRADGTAASTETVMSTELRRVFGLGVDSGGALFVSGTAADDDQAAPGVVVKRQSGGPITVFAAGLRRPVALAFAPNRDLLVIDQHEPGRVLRFRAPLPPVPAVPAFANQTPLWIGGHSGAGDRVDVFLGAAPARAAGASIADAASGAFTVQVPVDPNGPTDLSFTATGSGGAGLVSPPAAARIVHDDRLPIVTIGYPVPGAHVRDAVTLRARGEDDGSGVASVAFMLDADVVATVQNDDPAAPLAATAALDVRGVQDGPRTLTVAVTDRAGNTATAAQLLTVDRTPPDTVIVSGPSVETERTVTFTVGGVDLQSPALEFSWRLDEGAWTPYAPAAMIVLSDATPGTHRFEVKARDLAGNEDPTSAVQTFTVTALRVRIVEPAPGTVITTETVWVRGTVGSAGAVEITIPLPEEFRRELAIESVAVPAIAGLFAVRVPVTASTTALTITARDGQGAVASDRVEVGVQGPLLPSKVGFEAFPAAGIAPHRVRFGAASLPAGAYSLDLDSDGMPDDIGNALDGREFVYARPGIYVATLALTTGAGETLTLRTSVQVYDRAALEGQLRTAWAGFKEALRSGDVERLAAFVHSGRRRAWQEYFNELPASAFAAIDSVFTDVMLLEIAPGRAECEMMREVDGLLYSFPVSFRIDADGRWRLWQF